MCFWRSRRSSAPGAYIAIFSTGNLQAMVAVPVRHVSLGACRGAHWYLLCQKLCCNRWLAERLGDFSRLHWGWTAPGLLGSCRGAAFSVAVLARVQVFFHILHQLSGDKRLAGLTESWCQGKWTESVCCIQYRSSAASSICAGSSRVVWVALLLLLLILLLLLLLLLLPLSVYDITHVSSWISCWKDSIIEDCNIKNCAYVCSITSSTVVAV